MFYENNLIIAYLAYKLINAFAFTLLLLLLNVVLLTLIRIKQFLSLNLHIFQLQAYVTYRNIFAIAKTLI